MNEINHFKVYVLYSDDVTTDVDHLHVKRIHLVSFSYIVIEDYKRKFMYKESIYPLLVIY
jgi:hypothetical protein